MRPEDNRYIAEIVEYCQTKRVEKDPDVRAYQAEEVLSKFKINAFLFVVFAIMLAVYWWRRS